MFSSQQSQQGGKYSPRRRRLWLPLLAVLLTTGEAVPTEEKDDYRLWNLRRRRDLRHSSYARDYSQKKETSHIRDGTRRALRWVRSNRTPITPGSTTTSRKGVNNNSNRGEGNGRDSTSSRGGGSTPPQLLSSENIPVPRTFDEEEDSEDRYYSDEDRYYATTVAQPIRRHWTDESSGSQSEDRSRGMGNRDRRKKRRNMMGGGSGGGGSGSNNGGGGGGMRMRMRMGMGSSKSYPHPPPSPGLGYVTRRPTLRPTPRPIGTLFPTFVDETRPPTPMPTSAPSTAPVNIVRATMELVFVTPAGRRLSIEATPLDGEGFGLTDDEYAEMSQEYASLAAGENSIGRDFIPGEDRDLTDEEYVLLAEELSKFFTDSFASDASFELVGNVGIRILEESKMYFPGGYV